VCLCQCWPSCNENRSMKLKRILMACIPCQNDRVIFSDIPVPSSMFVNVTCRMIIIWYKRECPSGQYILAIPAQKQVSDRQKGKLKAAKRWLYQLKITTMETFDTSPDRFVAAGVLHTSGVAFFSNIDVYTFHQQIGR
jgi:hypothetical protein